MARGKGLARISAYARAEEHLREKTVYGGIVTIIGVVLALVLFVAEAHRCLSYRLIQKMMVDTRRDELLHINFNVSFPALPCSALTMDTGDASGSYHSEVGVTMARCGAMLTLRCALNGEIHKRKLDASGRQTGSKEYIPPHANAGMMNPFAMNFDLSSNHLEEMRTAMKEHEGCLIHGWVAVQRVAGNLHFSVRPDAMFMSLNENEIIGELMARHMHLQLPHHPDAAQLNASHIIHRLRFGEGHFPGQVHPLEGVARIDRKAVGIDKYYIKVVPTLYRRGGWRSDVSANQYSVTEYYQTVDPNTSNMLPGIFMLYDTSPIAIDIAYARPGILHLLVRTAAVVGGTFALTGFWDRIVHSIVLRWHPPASQEVSPQSRQRV